MTDQAAPLILIADPAPRTVPMIFDAATMDELRSIGRVLVHDDETRLSPEDLEAALKEAAVVVGQVDLPAERLEGMRNLRAVFNVEGNFLPNVDYAWCFAHGVHVLNTSPVYATSVAESALGFALDLCRDITATHQAFRERREEWGLESNRRSFLLTGSDVGIVGLGDLGLALRRMLTPFHCKVRVFDPWQSQHRIREHDCIPADLDELFANSRIVFLFASSTSDNQGFIGDRELDRMQPGSLLLVMSRAGIVDFSALERAVGTGRIRAGIDVFPVEPLAADSPLRDLDGLILSSHRSGGMRESFLAIGRLVVEDARLVLRGFPPQLCKRAEMETVARMRSRPVSRS